MANFVKKLIANFELRTEVISSQEEYERFLLENVRPDFNDEAIIAVKFIFSETEDFVNSEESSWFLSPSYVEEINNSDVDINFFEPNEIYDSGADADFSEAEEIPEVTFSDEEYEESYGPRIAAEIPPEILVLHINNNRSVLELYDKFHLHCLRSEPLNLSIKEKINKFVEFVDTHPY